MRRHLAYLKYLLLHKLYVFQAGLLTGAPIWRLIIHDWSKFRPSEWSPYARYFYRKDGSGAGVDDRSLIDVQRFSDAVQLHYKRNKHHWNYWVYIDNRSGHIKALDMPDKYVYEMVADWVGAGKAITGRWDDVFSYYEKNKEKMILSVRTQRMVYGVLRDLKDEF